MNPFTGIKTELADLEQRVRIAIETAMLREDARVALSRLKTLDPSRQADYSTALQAIGGGE